MLRWANGKVWPSILAIFGRDGPQPERLKDSNRGQVPAGNIPQPERLDDSSRGHRPRIMEPPTIHSTLKGSDVSSRDPSEIDDPFRVVALSIDVIRWRRPPSADLPPATSGQAFSLLLPGSSAGNPGGPSACHSQVSIQLATRTTRRRLLSTTVPPAMRSVPRVTTSDQPSGSRPCPLHPPGKTRSIIAGMRNLVTVRFSST